MVHLVEKDRQINANSYIQWITTLGVFLLMMEIGIEIGWASPNLARLTAENSPIPMTSDQASWVASCTGLGGLLGAIPASICMEYIGSKRTVLLSFIIICTSWICLIIADSVEWIYAARLLGGFTAATTYCSFPIYLGEVALPRIRGTVISIAAGGSAIGIVVGTVAETYLPMKISSSIYLAFSAIGIALFIWLMDSSYYLVKKGDLKRARKSLGFYYTDCDEEKELNEVKTFVEAHANQTVRDKLRELNVPVIRKSIFLIIVLFGLPHLSGMKNIASYMEIILVTGKSNLIEPKEFVIYANIASIVSTFLTVKLSDKFGRRIMLSVTSIGTSIAMVCLGLHFYLLRSKFDVENIQWLPIFSILLYLIAYSVGYTPVPSTVLSEIFPENSKSIAACVASLSAAFFGFTVNKAYQPIVDAFGEACAFWLHAVLTLLAIPCVLFLMPETKGKSFQEIQNDLMNR